MRRFFTVVLLFVATVSSRAETWTALGPPGGDVRALAVDPARPTRVFLGTTDGHIFGSEDSGAHWSLLGRAGARLDSVITAIVVDPRDGNVLFASSWTRDSAAGGGVFRSTDGGRTWSAAGLAGQAVRALVMALSDPNMLVAGTLDGVYRSLDASKSWERISPQHHEELRNLDSLAVDPRDPQIIYAGTFHLPWKTSDGGRTWRPIHNGMIDDSDVMSLLIDGANPQLLYASACSGIYRSDDSAAQWRKIQGIPYTARRTYAITQDPKHPARVYAATSEGLWKTEDWGMTWRRTTPGTWVVNTVIVADGNPGRVLIGTEELGVLESDDGGEHFQDDNEGFEHRQILALGLDPQRPGRVLVALAHSPEPVLSSEDDGRTWAALKAGLGAEQILRIYAAPDGAWWVSLARGGLMRYDTEKMAWKATGTVLGEIVGPDASVSPLGGAASVGGRQAVPLRPRDEVHRSKGKLRRGQQPLRDVVSDMAFGSKEWYAATSRGLLVSADQGANWSLTPVGPLTTLAVQSVRVSSNGERIRVVSLRGLVFSDDGGKSWTWHDLPLESGGAVALDAQPGEENTLVASTRNGLYLSRDAGETWQQAASGLPSTPVQSFAASGGVFVASMRTGGLYVSSDSGRTWDRVPGILADSFFSAVTASNVPGRVFAASATEGLYLLECPRPAASRAESPDQSRKQAAREDGSQSN